MVIQQRNKEPVGISNRVLTLMQSPNRRCHYYSTPRVFCSRASLSWRPEFPGAAFLRVDSIRWWASTGTTRRTSSNSARVTFLKKKTFQVICQIDCGNSHKITFSQTAQQHMQQQMHAMSATENRKNKPDSGELIGGRRVVVVVMGRLNTARND